MIFKENVFIPLRLREERERLSLTQEKVASHCETTVQTVRRWEKRPIIPAEKLSYLISLGFDIQYVISGKRTCNLDDMRYQFSGMRSEIIVKDPSVDAVYQSEKEENKHKEPAAQHETNNKKSKEAGVLSPRDQAWLELARHLPDDQRTRLQEIGDALVSVSRCCEKKDVS